MFNPFRLKVGEFALFIDFKEKLGFRFREALHFLRKDLSPSAKLSF